MKARSLVGLLVVAGSVSAAPSAYGAADDQCGATSGLREVSMTCQRSKEDVQTAVTEGRATYRYRISLVCWREDEGELCSNPRTCDDPPGTNLYRVERAAVGTED